MRTRLGSWYKRVLEFITMRPGLILVLAILMAHLVLYLVTVPHFQFLILASALVLSGLSLFLTSATTESVLGRSSSSGEREDARRADNIAGLVLSQFPDPLIVLDRNGKVVLSNGSAHSLIANAIPGRALSSALRVPMVLDAFERLINGGAAEVVEFETPGKTNSYSQAHCMKLPVSESAGLEDHFLVLLRDLTAERRVDQMRVDFIANVSHELKTPLASLSGFVETLQGPARDDEVARNKFLAIMHKQATRMGRLVDDLLALSRIELDEHVPPSEKVQLESVINEVITDLKPVADERAVEIAFYTEGDLPQIVASRDQMIQVFQNLISNAVRYGGEGSRVEISAHLQHKLQHEVDEKSVRIDVTDQGPGIAREHIPRLTERFYRVDENQSRTSGGTGLGLAIVKHIVARHQGELSIQSIPEKGSTFSVVVPIAPKEFAAPK